MDMQEAGELIYSGPGKSGRHRWMGTSQKVWCQSLAEDLGLFSCCLTPLGPGSFPVCRGEQLRLPLVFYFYVLLITLA